MYEGPKGFLLLLESALESGHHTSMRPCSIGWDGFSTEDLLLQRNFGSTAWELALPTKYRTTSTTPLLANSLIE